MCLVNDLIKRPTNFINQVQIDVKMDHLTVLKRLL